MRIEPSFGVPLAGAIPLERSVHHRAEDAWRTLLQRLASAFSTLSLFLIFAVPLVINPLPNSSTTEGQRLSPQNPGAEKDLSAPPAGPLAAGLAFHTEPEPNGRTTTGMVTWAPISDGTGHAVRATLYLAEPKVTVTTTFSKASEPNLNASYLLEVQIVGTFEEGPVQAVPRVLAKNSRLEVGQELAGIPLPVTDDLFWYALSKETNQDDSNRELLRTVSWIELTLVYRSALESRLTFEANEVGAMLLQNLIEAPRHRRPT